MKCSICGFDESILLKQKEEAIQQINNQIDRLYLEKTNHITKWKLENGFTDTVIEQLKQISSNLTEITIQAFLDNVPSFVKLDSRLQIVQDYCNKYGITQKTVMHGVNVHSVNQNRFIKNISLSVTIADVINRISQEPLPERIYNDIKAIDTELQMYIKAREDLDNIQTFFKEKVYSADIFDFSSSVNTSLKRLYEKTNKHIFPTYSILLCPTCASLFKEAASASFAIAEAKRIADEDIWDDDD